ncbi:uncharacterized protein TNCV_1661291 [Trichonephila clavipes]|nr:uncharacterized protein TNCV_1661291 [Trichonephila clavipes]
MLNLQKDKQPGLRMNDCEHRLLQQQIWFVIDGMNTKRSSQHVVIGQMSHVCTYCQALKLNDEAKGMCCAGRKIKLPHLEAPPEPLKTLLAGSITESKHFLLNIRKNNSCFQMTSFGAQIVTAQFMPTFKIKGQIYNIQR